MKTKEEYIAERIESYKKKLLDKSNMSSNVASCIDAQIEFYKNLSDEEYEDILKTEKEDAENHVILLSKLSELCISLEEFDNMSMEEIDEKFNKK